MSKKHKQVCATLNYIEQFLILVSAVAGCISISVFASLIGVPIGIMSSAIGLKVCAITAGIKKYKAIIKKKKKDHDKVVLLAKTKSNSIVVLIFKVLMESDITHDQFVIVNNLFKKYDYKK